MRPHFRGDERRRDAAPLNEMAGTSPAIRNHRNGAKTYSAAFLVALPCSVVR